MISLGHEGRGIVALAPSWLGLTAATNCVIPICYAGLAEKSFAILLPAQHLASGR